MEKVTRECNILGSGPSRISYRENELISIGCNFPWTKVDMTIFFDIEAIYRLCETPTLIDQNTKLIIHQRVYSDLNQSKKIGGLKYRIGGVFNSPLSFNQKFTRSSGHYAASWMINLGYNKLNIYGCDNFFGDDLCLINYSHEPSTPHYIENPNIERYSVEQLKTRGKTWREEWHKMIKQHPKVEFNFIP